MSYEKINKILMSILETKYKVKINSKVKEMKKDETESEKGNKICKAKNDLAIDIV